MIRCALAVNMVLLCNRALNAGPKQRNFVRTIWRCQVHRRAGESADASGYAVRNHKCARATGTRLQVLELAVQGSFLSCAALRAGKRGQLRVRRSLPQR